MSTENRRPTLFLLVGAPGTGKSTVARQIVREVEAELIQTDRVRKQLFGEPRYTGGEHSAVYGWCYNLIRTCLDVGKSVVFDATNLEERHRRRAYEIAEQTHARMEIIWTICPQRLVQDRLLRRHDEPSEGEYSDADWRIYLMLQPRAEPIRRPHAVLNTATDYSTFLDRLLQRSISAGMG